MRQRIRDVYAALKRSLQEHADTYACEPGFYNLVVNGKPQCQATNDEDLMKLALLSSLDEWQGANWVQYKGTEFSFIRMEMMMEAEDWFDLSPEELDMLKEDILTGGNEYAKLLESYQEVEAQLAEGDTLELLIHRAQAAMLLFRHREMMDSIERMKAFAEDPYCGIHRAVWSSLLHCQVIDQANICLDDSERMKEAVDLFAQNYELNSLTGCYDPVVYTDLWIVALSKYLFYLEIYFEALGAVEDTTTCPELFHPQAFCGVSRDFAASANPEILNLMKLHDELVLKNLVSSIEGYDYSPIFNGTILIMKRKLKEGQILGQTFKQSRAVFKTPHDVVDSSELPG